MLLRCIFVIVVLSSCTTCGQNGSVYSSNRSETAITTIDTSGNVVQTRIIPPNGYYRKTADSGSFTHYLRNLPLKPDDSPVLLYDGRSKYNTNAHVAVVDLEIGKRDLHQCADAVMRLRAEYLWKNKRYSDIHFNFTNGFRADYVNWMKGKRIRVNGNSVSWTNTGTPSNTYQDFWKYLEMVFSYAGTLSLSKELQQIPLDSMRPGDVFLRGGSPGHAIIVLDMASDSLNVNSIFLLAQSYMPAQEIHVLKNPNGEANNPWYPLNFGEQLVTPEWVFEKDELYRFQSN